MERALKRERLARKRAEELLENRSRELYDSKKALEASYAATVEVFASLIGGKSRRSPSDLRAIARDARSLGRILNLDAERIRVLYLSALLCDMGKLALPDSLLERPVSSFNLHEREHFHSHPKLAFDALIALKPLEHVAAVIKDHCELYDGQGYPNKRTWDEITIESKILCVIKDFDALKRGLLVDESLTELEAIEFLLSHRDKRYERSLVDEFVAMIRANNQGTRSHDELRLAARSLRPGMTLSRDLTNTQGVLILPAEYVLDEAVIEKLRAMSDTRDRSLFPYVTRSASDEDTLPRLQSAINR